MDIRLSEGKRRMTMSTIRRICLFIMIGALILNLNTRGLACESETAGSFSAKALPKGALSAGVSFEYRKYDELGHQNAAELHMQGEHVHNFDHDEIYNLSLAYGAGDDFEVKLDLPYVKKTFLSVHEETAGNGDYSRGLGDMGLSGKYCFYHGGMDMAALAGGKFPSGSTSQRGVNDEKLAVEELPGSGSFDYSLGLAVGKEIDRWLLGGGFLYTFKTQGARDYEFGDVLKLGFSSSYALKPIGQFPNYRLSGEIRSSFIRKDKDKGSGVASSGGDVLLFAPGIQLDINKQASAFISAPIPVNQSRGGEHSELDYSVIAGITMLWS